MAETLTMKAPQSSGSREMGEAMLTKGISLYLESESNLEIKRHLIFSGKWEKDSFGF